MNVSSISHDWNRTVPHGGHDLYAQGAFPAPCDQWSRLLQKAEYYKYSKNDTNNKMLLTVFAQNY